MTTQVKST